MPETIAHQIDALQRTTTSELAEHFAELHGYACRTRHRAYLVRKIAWRLQANADGDLTERARRRAEELADDAQVRVMAPRTQIHPPEQRPPTAVHRDLHAEDADPRLPPVGSAIVREYKGRTIRVVVRADGFEWEGERYRTLSAVAKRITSSHINGFRFFRLGGQR